MTLIMGILNVTPDSFSDGGQFLDKTKAMKHALRMEKEGADIIDVGGESSRPGSEGVSIEEELSRVIPVIEGVRKESKIPISIDTTKSTVAKHAIEAGANMINDISAGRFDPEMFPLAAQEKAPICLMHMKGTPKTMQIEPHYEDLIGEIKSFLKERIECARNAKIEHKNIIIDLGIGFGKTAEDNVKIIANIRQFHELGVSILLGASKKSFIGKLLGHNLNERLEATLATLALAFDGGVSIVRVHDVGPAKRFLDAYKLYKKGTFPL